MKHRFLSYFSIVIVFGILNPACQRPNNVLDRKKMESLMYDVYIAEALMERDYQTFNSPQKKEAFINSIFEKYRISHEQWDTSLVYYSDKIDIYLRINDSVKARIQREQKTLEAEQNRLSLQKELIDHRVSMVSYIPPGYAFSEADIRQGFRFRLDSTATAALLSQGQADFSFDVAGIPPLSQPMLNSVLMMEYKDTTIYRVNDISENQSYKTTASRFISNDTLKTISGFVRLKNRYGRFNGIQLYNIHLAPPQADTTRQSEKRLDSLVNKPSMEPELQAIADTIREVEP